MNTVLNPPPLCSRDQLEESRRKHLPKGNICNPLTRYVLFFFFFSLSWGSRAGNYPPVDRLCFLHHFFLVKTTPSGDTVWEIKPASPNT